MASKPDLTGQIHLVTGATSGIGIPTAIALAAQGAHVVIVGRDPDKTLATQKEVQAMSGNPQVDFLLADLSSQASIRTLAEAVKKRYEQLHVLVNNAGGVFMEREETVDGLEWTLAVNHLAYFLLTGLLLDLLKATPQSRIVNVASRAHESYKPLKQGGFWLNTRYQVHEDPIDGMAELQMEKYSGIQAYCQSKLANIMFTASLARKLEGHSVTANCLHPGVIATGFGRNNSGIMKWLVSLASPFLLSPEQGAQTTIHLASAPEVANISGKYFDKKKVVKSTPLSNNTDAQDKLWWVSERLTGLSY